MSVCADKGKREGPYPCPIEFHPFVYCLPDGFGKSRSLAVPGIQLWNQSSGKLDPSETPERRDSIGNPFDRSLENVASFGLPNWKPNTGRLSQWFPEKVFRERNSQGQD